MKRSFVASVIAVVSLCAVTSSGLAVTQSAVIDFEGFSAGEVVGGVSVGSGISGGPVSGSVTVFGDSANPSIGTNAAIVFDAACGGSAATCSGGDADLFKPALGNVLIMAEDLVDGSNDGLIDDPDDADLQNAPFSFDFSGFGPGTVTVESIDILDVEAAVEEPAFMELFDASNVLITTINIPATGDNGLATVNVNVSGVERMVVTLQGSGAIDNIRLSVDVPDEEPGNPSPSPPPPSSSPSPSPTPPPPSTPEVEAPFTPPTAVSCARLTANLKRLSVGKTQSVRVVVRGTNGTALRNARVNVRGAGVTASKRTNRQGVAILKVRATKPGIVTISTRGGASCQKRLGALAVFQPPITG